MLYIDAPVLKRMMISAANNISNNRDYVNELNVFPVPDGDTGSNMSMTALSVSDKLGHLPEDCSLSDVVCTITQAALRGARGNSGVIFSQLVRGFSEYADDRDSMSVSDVAAALQRGVDLAYSAVMRPTEGTMLTVARDAAAEAVSLARQNCSVEQLFEGIVKSACKSLQNTPQLLPVLKEAGVVDSGGMGLLKIYEGMLLCVKGEDVRLDDSPEPQDSSDVKGASNYSADSTCDIKFIYCTEFIINKNPWSFDTAKFKSFVSSAGDSEVIVDCGDTIKVHVHTNNPGEIIARACKIGELCSIKIDNMKLQHEEKLGLNQKGGGKSYDSSENSVSRGKAKKLGVISVSGGEGFSKIFADIGVDFVVGGENYINPSAEDIAEACSKINAENIFVLPNDKNVILAARQAKQLSSKNLVVIPTKTMPQGISCALAFDENLSLEENEAVMNHAIGKVKTLAVTRASKSLSIGGKEIKDGDVLAVADGNIKLVGSDIHEVAYEAVLGCLDDSVSLVTLFYTSPSLEEYAVSLAEKFSSENKDIEFNAEFGGQKIYSYIISVE